MRVREKKQKSSDVQQLLEVKIGAFVIVTLLVGFGVVFLLGQKTHAFEESLTLHASFTDVAGLRDGAAVRLSGVNVGTVSKVELARNLDDAHVKVDLQITRGALDRIRRDSIARIGAQGLLGDKIIEISLGSPSEPALQPGGLIETRDAADLNRVVEQAGQVMQKLQVVADNAAALMEGVGDPETTANIRSSASSVRHILRSIERGPGLAHSLVYDPRSAQRIDAILSQLSELVARANAGVARVEKVLAATDENGAQVINNLSMAAKNIGDTARDLNQSKMIATLKQASDDLAAMARFVKSGRGSVGGIIADPTLYHQLLAIVGGVERSQVLRSIVRYAVAKDDEQSAGHALEAKAKP